MNIIKIQSKTDQLKWKGNIILYSKYSGKVTRAFLDKEQDLFVFFKGNEKIELRKKNIDKIEVASINFSQRILNSTFPFKIVIESRKLDSGKIEFAVTSGKFITKEATLALYKKLEQFYEKDLPDFEAILFAQSKNTVKKFAFFSGIVAVFHFLTTRTFTLIELGAIVVISIFIVGEIIRKLAK